MSGSETIHIADLANPEITPALAAFRAGPVDFPDRPDADWVIDQAREMAGGLADFGKPDSWRERLQVMLQSLYEDPGMTRGGRHMLLAQIIRPLTNRLLIEDLLQRKPEIADIRIDRPVIIAGLPRSGTTHLVNWLARDSRLRSLTLWEAEEPVPRGEMLPDGSDPRIARAAAFWGEFMALVPHMAAMHEMEASLIHEDNDFLALDVNCYNIEWQARMPRWIECYFSRSRAESYLWSRRALQVLTYYRGPNRWILKSPQHMENLAALKAAFPDATLVLTHRDPCAVMGSLLTMVAYADRVRRDVIDPPALAKLWCARIARLLRACMAERDAWPAAQSLDVFFTDYMADQPAVMRAVYAKAGMALPPEIEAELLAYLAENPRNKHGRVVYDLAGDFAVDTQALRQSFQFYYDRFGVRPES